LEPTQELLSATWAMKEKKIYNIDSRNKPKTKPSPFLPNQFKKKIHKSTNFDPLPEVEGY
jgi:hypothetical protein